MKFDSFWSDLLAGLIATVVGGAFLTFIFFWIKEKIFPMPDIVGCWYFEMKTITTAYNPYKGMILRYAAIMWREENRIHGTVEKIYENSSTGERQYDGKNRTRGSVGGYVQKNYFSKDKVFIHIVEEGHGRESTNFFELIFDDDGKMAGTFHSMVAWQVGESAWQRDSF